MTPPAPAASGLSELQKRILSGLVMAAMAITVAIFGGWFFALFWCVAACLVGEEWQRIVHGQPSSALRLATMLAIILAVLGGFWASWPVLILALLAAPLIAFTLGTNNPRDTGIGVLYGAALGAGVVLCRGQDLTGMVVILWLFAVVWGTDTVAYFTGRALGGPKLWPRVSPKKTWSGALGGLLGAAILGAGVLASLGVAWQWQHGVLSILLSMASQMGDLFESAIKRRYDVKDSGTLIPGHGGFMDRLDGFIFAVVLAAIIGAWHAGIANVPLGLLRWT